MKLKLLSAETNLGSATSVSNNRLVRIYNSHATDVLTVTRKDNTGDQIGTYNIPPNEVMYCQKAYTDTLEGGTALKATAVGYNELMDFTWSGSSTSHVTGDLVLYLDAARSDSYPGSGVTWFDLSGNDYDATEITRSDFPTFDSDGFFVYDKDNYVVAPPDNATLNESIQFKKTFSVWFKTPSSFDTFSRGIFCMGNYNANYVIYIHDGVLYMGAVCKSSGDNWTTPTGAAKTVTASTWYNATLVLDAEDNQTLQNDVLKLYVNGSSIGTAQGHRMRSITTQVTVGGGCYGSSLNSATELYGYSVHGKDLEAGTLKESKNDSCYDGNISVAMMYNKALTSDEVLQNYNAFKGRYGY